MDHMKQVADAFASLEKNVLAKLDGLDFKQRELSDEILQLKQRGAMLPMDGLQRGNATLGSRVWEQIEQNRDLLGKAGRIKLEIKAAGDALTSASAATVSSGGVGSPGDIKIVGIQHGLPQRPAGDISSLTYSRYTGVEGNAGVQAGEGTARSATRPVFTEITHPALTIAGYTVISRQALKDSAELKTAIDVHLRNQIGWALDAALMDGNVTPTFSGLLTLATAVPSAFEELADAASEGVSILQESGFNPDLVVFNPQDWLQTQTRRGTVDGTYLAGPYLAPMPTSLRGYRVILSGQVPAGKTLVLDSSQCELLICEEVTFEIGHTGEQFTNNLATIVGELRVIPTFRSAGAARLMTPAP